MDEKTGQKIQLRISKAVRFALFCLLFSLILTWLPRSIFLVFPMVLAAGASLTCWIFSTPPPSHSDNTHANRSRGWRPRFFDHMASSESHPHHRHHHTKPAHTQQWREYMKSPVVEQAWETLCGSIVQEFIYDTWYAQLTPDKEFPAEIRRILNHAAGQLARRSRLVDMRALLNDICELVMEQVELYRDTRESILMDPGSRSALDFVSNEKTRRENALRKRMVLDGNLHPALQQPDGNYKMLRAISQGFVNLLLDPSDSSKATTRSIARELLAGCVFRPLLMWCTPYHINKGVYKLLKETVERRIPPPGSIPELDAVREKQLKGHWAFEQRIVKHAKEESSLLQPFETSTSSASLAMPPPPARHMLHSRSRSYDNFPQEETAATAPPAVTNSKEPRAARLNALPHIQLPHQQQQQQQQQRHVSWSAETTRRHSFDRGRPASATLPGTGNHGHTINAVHGTREHRPEMSADSDIASRSSSMSATSPMRAPAMVGHDLLFTAPFPNDMLHADVAVGTSKRNTEKKDIAMTVTVPSRSSSVTSTTTTTTNTNMNAVGLHPSPFSDVAGSFSSPGGHLVQHHAVRDDPSAPSPPQSPIEETSAGHFILHNNQHTSPGEHEFNYAARTVAASQDGQYSARTPAAGAAGDGDGRKTAAALCTNGGETNGFTGIPRAKVVAADLHTSTGTKDVVVYKIRVADDSGREWTVSRRYRHFEVLHRQLRNLPSYRFKLPPKRIFIHSQNVDFVEDRRQALDVYLQDVLKTQQFRENADLWEFLRVGSERFDMPGVRYGAAHGNSNGNQSQLHHKRTLSKSVLVATQTLGRGVVEATVDVTQAVTHGVKTGVTEVTAAAVGGVGAVIQEARSSLGLRSNSSQLHHRRSSSMPGGLDEIDPADELPAPLKLLKSGPEAIAKAGSGILRTATASARKVKKVLTSNHSGMSHSMSDAQLETFNPAARYSGEGMWVDHGNIGSEHLPTTVRSLQFAPGDHGNTSFDPKGSDQGWLGGPESTHGSVSSSSGIALQGSDGTNTLAQHPSTGRTRQRSTSPQKQSRNQLRSRKPTRQNRQSPVKQSASHRRLDSTAAQEQALIAERSSAFYPGNSSYNLLCDSMEYFIGDVDPGIATTPIEIDDFGAPSPGIFLHPGATEAFLRDNEKGFSSSGGYLDDPTSRHPGSHVPAHATAAQGQSLFRTESDFAAQLMDDFAGVSAPLYDIVDCLFQLQTRGFFRRQVYAMARQVLGMLAGDAVDVYIISKLRMLRQETTIAKILQVIQSSLWPGGVWFQHTPQYVSQQQHQQQQEPGSPSVHARFGRGMQAEKYLDPGGPVPLDEDELREAVGELLFSRAPMALVRLVGKGPYTEGVQDLFEMMQSATFMRQLGYGLLEIAALHVCPELKGLFQQLEHGGL